MPINDATVVWDSNRLHMRGRKASRSLQIVKDMAVVFRPRCCDFYTGFPYKTGLPVGLCHPGQGIQ